MEHRRPGLCEETHMDKIATHLGIDPLALRLKNAVKTGDRTATGQMLHSVGLIETLNNASKSARWNDYNQRENGIKTSTIKRGKGIACMFYPIGLTEKQNASAAIIKVNFDGTLNVHIGALDVGQGARTVLAQRCLRLDTATCRTTSHPMRRGDCSMSSW